MTALWRDSGTIATIVSFASRLISPRLFLFIVFLLNCLISYLTGTSFGTAATMGVICNAIGSSLGIPSMITGGVVLSGAFFGDRSSPVSTSALLISAITDTDIYSNIKRMFKSATIPFVLTCLIYLIIGRLLDFEGTVPDLRGIFSIEFNLSFVTVLPALILLLLSLLKVKVKFAMLASIIVLFPISIIVQDRTLSSLPFTMIFGYSSNDAAIAQMLNGGGIISMVRIIVIVALSSSYSGIFQRTGLLDDIKGKVFLLSNKTNAFFATLISAIATSIISCNQTLSIMLTNQLLKDVEKDKEKMAIMLEDTAVVIAPLVPWLIAGAVPLAAIGAPLRFP